LQPSRSRDPWESLVSLFEIGLTDHLEGPRDRPSTEIFDEVTDLVRLADDLGVRYAWFAEHHAHAHHGHAPTPLLFALHLAAQTRQIRLGTAIICLNLHHPLDVAEQVAMADVLTGGRMAVGFGSGSTPEEFGYFGLEETGELERHARFAEALRIIRSAWSAQGVGPERGSRPEPSHRHFAVPPHRPLPVPAPDLPARSWLAVNSAGSARIAGSLGFNMLFSHLRTPEQYRDYAATYREAGGTGLIAANRPVFVGPDDRSAFDLAETALRTLWRRFRREGKIPADTPEPDRPQDLC
jgi:alkanesulfonate monooxygenase SsuD/methylene tetrahydromethanopterin reductase-like flavin-dependent oxidoreductase (luciferase family)